MPHSFQEVVEAFYQNLYRFALSLCRCNDQAWDLTQETFLRWAKKRSSIRSQAATKSWLYTTLYREFLKSVKLSSRCESIDHENADETTHAIDGDQIRSAEAQDVLNELMRLKDGYRQVVSLYFLESYSYKEISEILNIPIGTVMSRLARGKEMLKENLSRPTRSANVLPFTGEQRRNYG